jgi:hypothetical protein
MATAMGQSLNPIEKWPWPGDGLHVLKNGYGHEMGEREDSPREKDR